MRPQRMVWLVVAGLLGSVLVSPVPAGAKPAAWSPTAPADVAGVRVGDRPVAGDRSVAAGRPVWSAEAEAAAVRGSRPVTWPAAGTATVDLGGVPVRADGLPVRVGRAEPAESAVAVRAPAGPARVRVSVADRVATAKAGVSGVLLAVTAADGRPGRVRLDVDYAGFAHAFGGDYATRLRLVQLPGCQLDGTRCGRSIPLATRNDLASRTVSAELDLSAAATTIAVTSGPSGDNGDYTATSLSSAATWQVSTSTGDFSYSYPLRMPPALGGPAPVLSFDYASGSVDGLTSTTNTQTSWVGDGWSAWSGSIERRYGSCTDDNPDHKTGDQCWFSDNATLSLGGRAGELIHTGGSTWRLKDDDGTRVERLTDPGRGNGDDNDEYWKVTTTDGTQYFFGYHRLPGWDANKTATQSTWTLPVYGDDADEPCHGATFATSLCTQAWRWNVDYIVDPRGNTAAFYYGKESGAYGRDNTPSQHTTYDRAGYLDHIDYGMRQGSEYASAAPLRVAFGTEARCVNNCWTGAPWTSDPVPASWLDTPWDQYCKAAPCTAQSAPTFWTARRLSRVATQIRNSAGGYSDVESWTLRHEFLNAGNGEGTPMWLRGITRTGHVTGTGGPEASEPEVTFDPGAESLPNRVDGASVGRSALNRWRIKTVTTASGGQIQVTYSPVSDCTRASLPDPAHNTTRCMPSLHDVAGTPTLDWFHKYVVTRIDRDDVPTDQPTEVTQYFYDEGAAWHYTTDELTKDKLRTWGQWRGYGKVRVRQGDPSGQQTETEHRFLRGMHGDRLPNNGVRSVQVTDAWGQSIEDHEALNGFTLGETVLNGPGGAEVSSTVNRPWRSGPTATRTRNGLTTEAWMVRTGTARARTALAAGGYRTTGSTTAYNSDGLVTSVGEAGDEGVPGDERCTRISYARNDTAWLIDTVAQTELLSVPCADAANPAHRTTVLSRQRTFYDDPDTFGAAPTRGNPVRSEELDRWTGETPVYVPVARKTFDDNGRVRTETDARGSQTTTVYTTANGGLMTQTSVTNALDHDPVVTTLEPAWGQPTRIVEENGETTDLVYDGLGKLREVWQPGRTKGTQTPSLRFTYNLRGAANQPTVVTSEVLLPSGSGYRKENNLYDGWWRLRQTQTQATGGGRLLTDVRYDTAGNRVATTLPYHDKSNAAVGTDLKHPQETVPGVKQYVFDRAGRQTAEILIANGAEKWRTTTGYGGDRTHTTPPTGGTATTSITDVRGRVVEFRQYPIGSPVTFQATTYTYDLSGGLRRIRDAAGNEWKYDYDLRGRRTLEKDPDRGETRSNYDATGNLESTVDALNQTLWYGYDSLGRKTSVRDGSATGPKRIEWTYDTATNGEGRLASSTRWVGTTPYTNRVDAYDAHGRATTTSLVLPASEGALCAAGGTTPCVYTTTTSYKANGDPYETTLPAAGDLPSERMTRGYTDIGMPNTLISNLANYVFAVTYNKIGQLTQRQLGRFGFRVAVTTQFDEPTRRLAGSLTELELKPDAANYQYTHDAAGNITKISNGVAADHQCFRYDHLRRLTSAWTPGTGDCAAAPSVGGLQNGAAAYWHDNRYDVTGNRIEEVSHATAGDTKLTFTSPASGPTAIRPHTVSSVKLEAPGGVTWTRAYGYDNAGNTIGRPSAGGTPQVLGWDSENRLATLREGTAATTRFLYDADGNRLIRTDADGTRTLYLPDGAEVRAPAGSSTAVGTRYYVHVDTTVAMRTSAGVTWLVGDNHGTAEVAVRASDLTLSTRRTTPFGRERGTPPSGWPAGMDKGFVGGTKDASGLVHLGAREYDPTLGRFVSDDPILDSQDPQQMHGYAYSNNNPVTFSDASGLIYCEDTDCTSTSTGSSGSSGSTGEKATGSAGKKGTGGGKAVGRRAKSGSGKAVGGLGFGAIAMIGGRIGARLGSGDPGPTPTPSPEYCRTPESLYCTPDPNMPLRKCKDFGDPGPCDSGPAPPVEDGPLPGDEMSDGEFLAWVLAYWFYQKVVKPVLKGLYWEAKACWMVCYGVKLDSTGAHVVVGGVGSPGLEMFAGWNSAGPDEYHPSKAITGCAVYMLGGCGTTGVRKDGTRFHGGAIGIGVPIGHPHPAVFLGTMAKAWSPIKWKLP